MEQNVILIIMVNIFILKELTLLNVSDCGKLDKNILTWHFEWHIYNVRNNVYHKSAVNEAMYKSFILKDLRISTASLLEQLNPCFFLVSLQKFETADCLGQENVAIRKNMIDVFSVHTCDRYLVTRNNVAFLCQR